ncbi:hypothetical protein EX30DRAFT_339932 [Ascodesmis nigricans]|uniref:DNA repair protein Dds20/Mei5 n=1 Tax=Ascodesmis nigricans TaxID=341454 RepID=A0A4V3SIZ1_9PEZI|nr:hypothetical protein EX30DRAFT_339932 [Ascodesmis nigricans]
MSTSTPPKTPLPSSKRRRIDANATLAKPFRSPLIKKPDSADSSSERTQTPSSTVPSTPISVSRPLGTVHPPNPLPTPLSRRPRPITSPLKPLWTNPALTALQKKHTALTNQLREARQSLATAQQAADLEASTKDVALKGDIERWQNAGRSAAEALFAAATERVNRLGGPGGEWKDVLFKKSRWAEEEEEERKQALEDAAEERGVTVEELLREAEAQGLELGDSNSGGVKGVTEEATWGMGVMLTALGISHDMLGWDEQNDCWKD